VAHLLAVTAPRPRSFFTWIVGLATVIGVVLPFTTDGSAGGKLATAGTNLVLGLCIVSLLSSVLARTTPVPGPTPRRAGCPAVASTAELSETTAPRRALTSSDGIHLAGMRPVLGVRSTLARASQPRSGAGRRRGPS